MGDGGDAAPSEEWSLGRDSGSLNQGSANRIDPPRHHPNTSTNNPIPPGAPKWYMKYVLPSRRHVELTRLCTGKPA